MLAAITQFEREISSELVRDKIESSKIQGLWCGGSVSFGYKAENKKLVISEENARIVRNIFKEFVNGSSINNILSELRSYGLKTKKGNNMTSNVIKNMLKNPTYIGKVQLKGLLYDGVHKAIVDYDTWNKAQEILLEMKRNAPVRKKQLITKNILSGLVYCGDCNKILTPTYTTKTNLSYRYYICQNYTKGYNTSCQIKRINANQLEDLVIREIFKLLTSLTMVNNVISLTTDYSSYDIDFCCKRIEDIWDMLLNIEQRKVVLKIINRINVHTDKVEIEIKANGLEKVISEALSIELSKVEGKEKFTITIPISVIKSNNNTKIIQSNNEEYIIGDNKYFNPLLEKIALANKWRELIETGVYKSLTEFAKSEKREYTTVCKIYHLNYLAPDIVEYIANNQKYCQYLPIHKLCRIKFPLLWQEQRDLLLPILKGQIS